MAKNGIKKNGYIDLGFAKYDLKREKIKGFPEVIFAKGKSLEQLSSIVSKVIDKTNKLLITKVTPEQFKTVKKALKNSKYAKLIKFFEKPGLIYIGTDNKSKLGKIVVVCAGTADLPVAEEAAVTLEIFGNNVVRLYDVGVAGLHRLLDSLSVFHDTNAVIVVAGMEGALSSVVGGLVSCPVIAVPTSIGYGSSFEGLAALLTMMNSCAVGMSVVNIDNGFGAAYQAHLINKQSEKIS